VSVDALLKIAGVIFLGYALLHFAFPKRFRWQEELGRLSLLNRRIFVVHTTFIVLTLLLLGVLCVAFTAELLAPTRLGRVVLAGLFVFAAARLLAQFFLYDASLWRGHAFNTRVHAVFVTTWSYLVVAFGIALLR
jgi:hypothetical protein